MIDHTDLIDNSVLHDVNNNYFVSIDITKLINVVKLLTVRPIIC